MSVMSTIHLSYHQHGQYVSHVICLSVILTSLCLSVCQTYNLSVHHTSIMTSWSICQPHESPVHHTNIMTSLSICQTHNSSVHRTSITTSWSICQSYDMSIHHTNIMTSLSVCLSYQMSDHHTINMASPSICQSNHLSVYHTANTTSLSICQTHIPSVCHTVMLTSPSVCQLHDLTVCQPTCDVTRNTVWLTVCPSSVTSILPSANFMVKMPMSLPAQKFPNMNYPGKFLSVYTSLDSSVHHPGNLFVNLSPSAANPSKSPVIIGRIMQ